MLYRIISGTAKNSGWLISSNPTIFFLHILAIAVLINRLNMSSVTVGIDGTLFRHHAQFKQNLSRTLGRLVLRTVSC